MEKFNYNRIKGALSDEGKTSVELAAFLNRTPQAVSRWCRNVAQPDLPTLYQIADFLNKEVCDLLVKKKDLQAVGKGKPGKKSGAR